MSEIKSACMRCGMAIQIPTKKLDEFIRLAGCWICQPHAKWGNLIVAQSERMYDVKKYGLDSDAMAHLHALEWKSLAEVLYSSDGARFG